MIYKHLTTLKRIIFLEIGWGGMDWIRLAQDRDKCRVLVNTAMRQILEYLGDCRLLKASHPWTQLLYSRSWIAFIHVRHLTDEPG
jgi:hypothetical protein